MFLIASLFMAHVDASYRDIPNSGMPSMPGCIGCFPGGITGPGITRPGIIGPCFPPFSPHPTGPFSGNPRGDWHF